MCQETYGAINIKRPHLVSTDPHRHTMHTSMPTHSIMNSRGQRLRLALQMFLRWQFLKFCFGARCHVQELSGTRWASWVGPFWETRKSQLALLGCIYICMCLFTYPLPNPLPSCLYACLCTYICMYIYIHIYIERERDMHRKPKHHKPRKLSVADLNRINYTPTRNQTPTTIEPQQ